MQCFYEHKKLQNLNCRCNNCGKKFHKQHSRVLVTNFCSQKCRYTYKKILIDGFKPININGVKENLYLINKQGDIYSLYKHGLLSPSKDQNGYLRISLSCGKRGNKKYFHIHTLVMLHFGNYPPKQLSDPTIDHIDGNILNNDIDNLRWLERGVNSSIRKNKGQGENNHEAKLKDDEVKTICSLLRESNLTLQEIANKYNVSKSTINNIKRGVQWKHITQNI